MAYKIVVLCALLSAVNAGLSPVPYSSVNPSQDAVGRSTYAKTLTFAAPQAVYSHAAPAAVYSQHVAPATVYSHAGPTVYSHGAPAAVYAQPAAHAIAYSPAATVAHVTFDGFGAHYGY